MSNTYAAAGVNVELGDDVSKLLYNAAKATWHNRQGKLGEVIVPFDDFSGVRAVNVGGLPTGTLMNIGFDGIGTKVEIAERVGDHSTMAFDLFAMVVDDAVVRGAEPVLVGSILDVNALGKDGETFLEQVKQLAQGYVAAANAANVAVVNGEVAELGAHVQGYGKFNYNWGAAVVWFARQDRMLTGQEVKVGDAVVALKEDGIRCNGFSLVRKIMRDTHGDDWHNVQYQDKTLGAWVLHPSRIYCAAVVEMFGGVIGEPKAAVHGVAHITGGGVAGKLGRVLKPSGLGARLDNLFTPSEMMLYCQEQGQVADDEAYKTWNMGQGMLVITPEPDKVIAVAQQHNITAQVAGQIVAEPGITVTNKGYFAQQQPQLTF